MITILDDVSLDFSPYKKQPDCATCENYLGNNRCKAFTEGIPTAIINADVGHKEHIEGDNDIVWQPKPTLAELIGE